MKQKIAVFTAISVALHFSLAAIFAFITPSVIEFDITNEHGSSSIILNLQSDALTHDKQDSEPGRAIKETPPTKHIVTSQKKTIPQLIIQPERAQNIPRTPGIKSSVLENASTTSK